MSDYQYKFLNAMQAALLDKYEPWTKKVKLSELLDTALDNTPIGAEVDPIFNAWLAGPPNISLFNNNLGYLTAETDPVFSSWLSTPPAISLFNNGENTRYFDIGNGAIKRRQKSMQVNKTDNYNCCYESIRKLREINDLIDSHEITINREKSLLLYEGWEIKTLFQADDGAITVGTCVIRKTGQFPNHCHKESLELFIVDKGEVKVHLLDEDVTITVNDKQEKNFVYIKAGAEHVIEAEEGSLLTFILIPSDKGFPIYDDK